MQKYRCALVVVLVFSWGALRASATDTSGPVGTWFLNANNQHLTVTIESRVQGVLDGTWTANGRPEALDRITWNAARRRLEFRRVAGGFWEWYRGSIVEGVLVGRFSRSASVATRPMQFKAYAFHVTGWNSSFLDAPLAPRVFEIVVNQNQYGRLRLDHDPQSATRFVGRMKIYATAKDGAKGEGPEEDIAITQWDGVHLRFTRTVAKGTQTFTGMLHLRTVSGSYTQSGQNGSRPWSGTRAEVLSYGFAMMKDPGARARWQARTRRQIEHLMMADDPGPTESKVTVLRSNLPPIASRRLPAGRDDNPAQWPQHYVRSELQFDFTLPNPYGGPPLNRRAHAYLAVPTTPPPAGGRYPALLALNGHGGSAWKVMDPDNDLYWYGDAFARRGFVVLALDISHRPPADRRVPYQSAPFYTGSVNGDDADHGNGPHPSITAVGFDSDWEEDGERVWDAMRGFDYLAALPNVDRSRIVVTGLSMGGEVTTLLGGLEDRLAMVIPAGFSPDLGVMAWHGNHPCWRWTHADIREYVDVSDLEALAAPWPLIVETGAADPTYSSLPQPFASDKQVLRRSRNAYGGEAGRIVHYLHGDQHRYHVGDVNPSQASEIGLRTPAVIAPTAPASDAWQRDDRTFVEPATSFDYIAFFLK